MNIQGIIRTTHDHAQCIADSISVDNLSEMKTYAEGSYVITQITSTKVRSVIASMDDYLMNLTVAEEVCEKSSQTSNQEFHNNTGRN